MPIYEYRCRDCDRLFPRLQSMGSSTKGISCPECGSQRVERQVSSFASGSSSSSPTGFQGAPPGCAHSGGG